MPDAARPKLEIVKGRRRVLPQFEDFVVKQHGAQGALFPTPKHGVLIFVNCPEVRDEEFLRTMECARPSFVIDLRDAPRFDIGSLNRFAVFDLFERLEVNYVDIHSYAERARNSKNVSMELVELLRTTTASRPIMFLLGTEQGTIASGDDLLKIMTEAGKEVGEVYEVPHVC